MVGVPDAVDDRFITNSPTYKYLSSKEMFIVRRTSPAEKYQNKLVLRNRSYAMNAHMGATATSWVNNNSHFRTSRKLSDMDAPSQIYNLIDEHEKQHQRLAFFPIQRPSQLRKSEMARCALGPAWKRRRIQFR